LNCPKKAAIRIGTDANRDGAMTQYLDFEKPLAEIASFL